MADNTEMNSQVTDAVSQEGLLTEGTAPALAVGHGYQSMAQSTGLSFQNAVSAQQQGVVQSNVEAVLLTQHLLGLITAEFGAATSTVYQSSPPLLPLASQSPRKRQARRR